MTTAHDTSPRWNAPAEDGQVLLWPDSQALRRQTRENHRQLASASARIQNLPASELRTLARQWLGHADGQQPLIVTGHQIELMHPGVWAKIALINELAGRLGGAAAHIAVDTDAPKHLRLQFPGGAIAITDDPALTVAAWSGLLQPPSPAHLKRIESTVSEAARDWPFQPLLPDWLAALRRLAPDASDLPTPLTNAMHQLDWSLGLRHHLYLASPIWHSPAFLVFVHHILARAHEFARTYNATLAAYRRQNRISDPGRPWPDLRVEHECCEVPFWLDLLADSRRHRACVTRQANESFLRLPDGAQFALDASADGLLAAERLARFLSAPAARLSPRALTLTAFVRLFLADQFVHGIGGGLYDQITDRIIHAFFGIRPPAFSVTTATLLFPTAASQRRIDLDRLLLEGRRLRHGDATPRKMQFVQSIAAAPRKTQERQQLYQEMHRFLTRQLDSAEYKDWQGRFSRAQQAARAQDELFDRELFYALQPRDRLDSLIAGYHALF